MLAGRVIAYSPQMKNADSMAKKIKILGVFEEIDELIVVFG